MNGAHNSALAPLRDASANFILHQLLPCGAASSLAWCTPDPVSQQCWAGEGSHDVTVCTSQPKTDGPCRQNGDNALSNCVAHIAWHRWYILPAVPLACGVSLASPGSWCTVPSLSLPSRFGFAGWCVQMCGYIYICVCIEEYAHCLRHMYTYVIDRYIYITYIYI